MMASATASAIAIAAKIRVQLFKLLSYSLSWRLFRGFPERKAMKRRVPAIASATPLTLLAANFVQPDCDFLHGERHERPSPQNIRHRPCDFPHQPLRARHGIAAAEAHARALRERVRAEGLAPQDAQAQRVGNTGVG